MYKMSSQCRWILQCLDRQYLDKSIGMKSYHQDIHNILSTLKKLAQKRVKLQEQKLFNPYELLISNADVKIKYQDSTFLSEISKLENEQLNQFIQTLLQGLEQIRIKVRDFYSKNIRESEQDFLELKKILMKYIKKSKIGRQQQKQIQKHLLEYFKKQNYQIFYYAFQQLLKNLEHAQDKVILDLLKYLEELKNDINKRNSKSIQNFITAIRFKNQALSQSDLSQLKRFKDRYSQTDSIESEQYSLMGQSQSQFIYQKIFENELSKNSPEFKKDSSKFIFRIQRTQNNKNKYRTKQQIQINHVKFNNQMLIIQLLAKINPDQQYDNIAKYSIHEVKKDKNGDFYKMQYQMEKGQRQCSILLKSSETDPNERHIYSQGKSRVVSFAMEYLLAIIQLNEIGIYHADLLIKNFIQFKNKFQVIDFKNALFCSRNYVQFEKINRKIFENWLRDDPNKQLDILFNNGQASIIQKLNKLKLAYRRQNRDIQKYIMKCLDLLQQLKDKCHKKQVINMFKNILFNQSMERQFKLFTHKQIKDILSKLNQEIQSRQTPNYSNFISFLYRYYHSLNQHQSNQIDELKHIKQTHFYCGKLVTKISKEIKLFQNIQSSNKDLFDKILKQRIDLYRYLSQSKLQNISKPYYKDKFVQQKDFKIVYRDDAYQISSPRDVWSQGEVYFYEFISKMIHIIEQLESHSLYHLNLKLQSFVRKSHTTQLRHMHEAYRLPPQISQVAQDIQIDPPSQLNKIEQNLNKMKQYEFFQKMKWFNQLNLDRLKNNQRINKALHKSMKQQHLQRFKLIVKELLQFDQTQLKVQSQLQPKETIKRILSRMTTDSGYGQLRQFIDKKIQSLISNNSFHHSKQKKKMNK